MNTELKEFSSNIFHDISVVTSLYNEEDNVLRLWKQLSSLEQYLNIEEFVMVNNGSTDNTLSHLNKLSSLDSRVKVYSNKNPSDYSMGVSKGIEMSKSKYSLITHSDCQFSLDSTIKSWLEYLYYSKYYLNESDFFVAFSKRYNRDLLPRIFTAVNNYLFSSLLLDGFFIDFNSSPKIIPSKFIKDVSIKNGYVFDAALVCSILSKRSNKLIEFKILPMIPVILNKRTHGKSSWDSNILGYHKIVSQYLHFLVREILK